MVEKTRWKKELKRERREEREERAGGARGKAPSRERAAPSRTVSAEAPQRAGIGPHAQLVLALVTGLAVGFAVGRETGRSSSSKSEEASAEAEPSEAQTAPTKKPVKVYKKESEFPAGWVKSADLQKDTFNGLTEAQKTTALQALNERTCECGCNFGSLAECLHKDPNCPRSPQIAKLVADLVKQGKALPAVLAAIDKKQQEMGGGQKPAAQQQQPPADTGGRQKIQIARWSPRKGPKTAKVTLVEVSDFQ
jgi:hypothetical protein